MIAARNPLRLLRRHAATESAFEQLGPMRDEFIDAMNHLQERVESEKFDLVILCARRLPCLYQVLLESGHSGITGAGVQVVSDRFLDVACEWTWKNVLIVDDTVVLGTTLTALYDQVLERVNTEAGGGSVSTFAVCLDTDRSATYLLDRINFDQQVKRGRPDTEAFSKAIVTTLFRNQRPFFSDFPVTGRITMDADRYARFAADDGYTVADVTSSLVAARNQGAYVQLPNPDTSRNLLTRLPVEVEALVSAFKLRSWVTRSDDEKQVDVTFVPLALLGGATEDDLDAAIVSLGAYLDAPELEKLRLDRLSGEAKHRLLQMFTSVFLLAAAMPADISAQLTKNNAWVDDHYTRLYFGSKTAGARELFSRIIDLAPKAVPEPDRHTVALIEQPRASELLEDNKLRELLWASRELLASTAVLENFTDRPVKGEMTKVGVVASHAISSLFGYISGRFEVGQQDDIRKLDNYERYRANYVDVPGARVLHQAFTMQELTDALIADNGQQARWNRAIVSLGVDIGNDLGIVVPTTLTDHTLGVIYRAYRLGETAPLASQPLVMWDPRDGTDALDAFSRTIADGQPALSKRVKFSLPDSLPAKDEPTESDSREVVTLVDLHRDAFPGRPVARFEGRVVTEVRDDDTFDAHLFASPTLTQSNLRLKLNQVPDDEVDLVGIGARFRWTVFERTRGTRKDRTSRVQFERPAYIEERDAEQVAVEFGWLATYDPGGSQRLATAGGSNREPSPTDSADSGSNPDTGGRA